MSAIQQLSEGTDYCVFIAAEAWPLFTLYSVSPFIPLLVSIIPLASCYVHWIRNLQYVCYSKALLSCCFVYSYSTSKPESTNEVKFDNSKTHLIWVKQHNMLLIVECLSGRLRRSYFSFVYRTFLLRSAYSYTNFVWHSFTLTFGYHLMLSPSCSTKVFFTVTNSSYKQQ